MDTDFTNLAADEGIADVPHDAISPRSTSASAAYRLIHAELALDGAARLNLATFVTTWMEPEAQALVTESLDKNLVDKDEYPQTAEFERRCTRMLADLWHAPDPGASPGCSTTGSSEACMLGGLALLRRWRTRRGDAAGRPNLVMGANVQVCWEKFCAYWDVEARLVPVGDGATHLVADRAAEHCDENTIGVVAILGSTFDGSYEPVAEISAALDELAAGGGPDVPIHVDAASGGFVAPFIDLEIVWDFRLPRVQSINASGHKYGLVYPGVGWAVWRDKAALPEDLVFHVDYLGGDMPTFSLNFSRPGAQVIAQYYMFVRLGIEGFTLVQDAARSNAMWLAEEVGRIDELELVSRGDQLPVFAFRVADAVEDWTAYDLSELLRLRGWIVPAYQMPQGMEEMHVLRIVVRVGFSRDMARTLIGDIEQAVERLNTTGGITASETDRTSFHH